jgi:hypothetical protein
MIGLRLCNKKFVAIGRREPNLPMQQIGQAHFSHEAIRF